MDKQRLAKNAWLVARSNKHLNDLSNCMEELPIEDVIQPVGEDKYGHSIMSELELVETEEEIDAFLSRIDDRVVFDEGGTSDNGTTSMVVDGEDDVQMEYEEYDDTRYTEMDDNDTISDLSFE